LRSVQREGPAKIDAVVISHNITTPRCDSVKAIGTDAVLRPLGFTPWFKSQVSQRKGAGLVDLPNWRAAVPCGAASIFRAVHSLTATNALAWWSRPRQQVYFPAVRAMRPVPEIGSACRCALVIRLAIQPRGYAAMHVDPPELSASSDVQSEQSVACTGDLQPDDEHFLSQPFYLKSLCRSGIDRTVHCDEIGETVFRDLPLATRCRSFSCREGRSDMRSRSSVAAYPGWCSAYS